MRLTAIALGLVVFFASAAFAQEGQRLSAGAVQAAKEFTSYLGKTAAAKAKLDLTAPPAAPLFAKIFDTKALATLPAPTAKDLSWASEWLGASANSYMALLNFGTNPQAPDYQQAVEDNVQRYEDEISNAMNFMIRLMPRVAISARGFMQIAVGSRAQSADPPAGREEHSRRLHADGFGRDVVRRRRTESAQCKTGRPRLARHRGRMARAGVRRRTHAACRLSSIRRVRDVKDPEVAESLAAIASALAAIK